MLHAQTSKSTPRTTLLAETAFYGLAAFVLVSLQKSDTHLCERAINRIVAFSRIVI
jgi:hypothetical protein